MTAHDPGIVLHFMAPLRLPPDGRDVRQDALAVPDEVRRLLAVVPDTVAGRRDRALLRGISSATFYARFRRYLRAAGLAPTGLHILRQSAAKLRRDAGASIEAVSNFLDHSSLSVTTIYLRRLEGQADRTWPDVAVAIGV